MTDALDNLDERVKNFFKKCTQPNIKGELKDEQYKQIKQVNTDWVMFCCFGGFFLGEGGSTVRNGVIYSQYDTVNVWSCSKGDGDR